MKKTAIMSLMLILSILVLIGCEKQNVESIDSTTSQLNSNTETNINEGTNNQVTGNMIAKVGDVESGKIMKFTYEGKPAILINFNGEFTAYVNSCTHKQLEFDENSIKNERIQCPWHGATFKPADGEYLGHANGANYGLAGLTTINIKVENGNIYTV